MPESDSVAVEWIIANTINQTAGGDPDALASRIVAALAAAGYGIVPVNGIEDTALGPQPFDKLTREMRPQDPFGDQTIKATDAAGRWAIYVPLTRGGKIVVPRPYPETVSSNRAETRQLKPGAEKVLGWLGVDALALKKTCVMIAAGDGAILSGPVEFAPRKVSESAIFLPAQLCH